MFRVGKSVIITCCAVLSFDMAHAQEKVVTLPSQSISIRDALREIESQTDYLFALGHSNFDMSRTVQLSNRQASVGSLLNELLRNSGRTYRLENDNQILILPMRIDPGEEKTMAVLRFDWSKSYNDNHFEQDAEGDLLRRSEPPEKKAELPQIEIIEIIDSVFNYPSHTFTISSGKNTLWTRFPHKQTGNHLALKTNILHLAIAQAPNIGLEVGLSSKTSLDLSYGFNYWNRDGSYNDNKKSIHWYLRPEFRYWFCDRFDGHFLGTHAFYWQYNISQHDIPLMFDKEYQYEGNAFGVGISYGYHWVLGKHWGIEFNAGVGVAFMKYDKYGCAKCGDMVGDFTKTYFGPTSIGIKLVYLIK